MRKSNRITRRSHATTSSLNRSHWLCPRYRQKTTIFHLAKPEYRRIGKTDTSNAKLSNCGSCRLRVPASGCGCEFTEPTNLTFVEYRMFVFTHTVDIGYTSMVNFLPYFFIQPDDGHPDSLIDRGLSGFAMFPNHNELKPCKFIFVYL